MPIKPLVDWYPASLLLFYNDLPYSFERFQSSLMPYVIFFSLFNPADFCAFIYNLLWHQKYRR